MNISPFSKYIFWSYKPNTDLPEDIIIQQVVAYGEIADLRLISKIIPRRRIEKVIEKWINKQQYKKRINFLKQVFLYE